MLVFWSKPSGGLSPIRVQILILAGMIPSHDSLHLVSPLTLPSSPTSAMQPLCYFPNMHNPTPLSGTLWYQFPHDFSLHSGLFAQMLLGVASLATAHHPHLLPLTTTIHRHPTPPHPTPPLPTSLLLVFLQSPYHSVTYFVFHFFVLFHWNISSREHVFLTVLLISVFPVPGIDPELPTPLGAILILYLRYSNQNYSGQAHYSFEP